MMRWGCSRFLASSAVATIASVTIGLSSTAGTFGADSAVVPHMSHTVEVTGEVTEADGVKTVTTDAVKHVAAN